MSLAVTLAAAMVAGLALGMLGGGGSILTVPILIYLAQVPPEPAIATSLLVVAVTSLAGLVTHARVGRVRWRVGALFGVAGMVGAYAGGRAAAFVPATVLLIGFGVMMLSTAVAMLRPRRRTAPAISGEPSSERPPGERPVAKILAEGVGVGLVTGFVGAGGGFLVVPALVLLGGLPMSIAVGTSLLVIAMQSFAGLAGHLHTVSFDWPLALSVTAVAVLGGMAGGVLAGRVHERALRRAFGWFVVAMAVFVLAGQIPAGPRGALLRPPVVLTLLVVLLAGTAALVVLRRRAARQTRIR